MQVSNQSDGAGIILALESKDLILLTQAKRDLLEQLPHGCLVSEERDPSTLSLQALSWHGAWAV